MTEITSMNTSEWRGSFLRGIMMITNKKWIMPGAMVALLYVAWTALPLGGTAAQSPPSPVPALVAGPVGIKGTTPSPSADVTPRERAVLMVTNVGDHPIPVRMEIRDATDFSRILVQVERTLQPGEGGSVAHMERANLFRSLIGIVSPSSGPEPWSVARLNFAATLSVVDDSTNTTQVVVGTNNVMIRVPEESTVRRR